MVYRTRLLDILRRANERNARYPREPGTILEVLRLVNLRNELRQKRKYLVRSGRFGG